MTEFLLSNILILSGLAFLSAIMLYFVSQKFAIKQDPILEAIYNELPHANCGGCGKAGCQDFANACANASEEDFGNLNCPVGGAKVMNAIAKIKGFDNKSQAKTCAVFRCQGSCKNAPDKMQFSGLKSCRVASVVMSGQSGCPNGCLRFGDCIKVCKFGALTLDDATGTPIIDYTKCTSCGACVKRCPRGLFEIRPIEDNSQVYVACRNQQKGAVARKNCSAACIACGKCLKVNDQVILENNLSYIPTTVSPMEYGKSLAEACPVKAIIYRENMLNGVGDED